VNPIIPKLAFPPKELERMVLYGVPWATYEKLIDVFAELHVRMTYDQSTLELMSPQTVLEQFKVWFRMLFTMLARELDIPLRGLGSTTIRRKEAARGFDPDECYCFAATIALVSDWRALDLDTVPIPDLVLEMETHSPCLDRMPVLAGLGVPEVWRIREEAVRCFRLVGTEYEEVAWSPNLPFVPLADLPALLLAGIALRSNGEIMLAQEAWIRQRVRPLYDAWLQSTAQDPITVVRTAASDHLT
jgi:hypothetical protein